MKELFIEAEIEIIILTVDDVISTSQAFELDDGCKDNN